MRNAIRILQNKDRAVNVYLLIPLLLLTAAAAYFISHAGFQMGALVIMGTIGVGVGVFMIVYPEFGYYVSIIVSFFIFTLLRFLNTTAPLVTAVDLCVWATFIGVLIRKGVRRESLWMNCGSPIMFMYVLFFIYTGLEYFNPNGGNPELYFLFLRRTITLLLFLYCSIQLLEDTKAIKRFFRIWLFLCFLAAVYACYEQWLGMPAFELYYIQSDPLREQLARLDGGTGYRLSSFVASCTDFGLLESGVFVIFLALYMKLKLSGRMKAMFLVTMLMTVLAMTYSGTRTATLMLVVEIVLYALMTINDKRTMIFSSFFGFIMVVIIFGPSYGNQTLRRLKSTFDLKSEESLKVRDVNRHHIQPYIYSHPMGGGVGTTGVPYARYNVGHPLAGFPDDSGLLAIVLEYGMIGLLIQCVTYFVILSQGVTAYFRSPDPTHRAILLACVVCLFGYVFAQYAQVAIGQIPSGFLFLALNAVIIRLRQIEAAKDTPQYKYKLSA